jgi:hypothetical protein
VSGGLFEPRRALDLSNTELKIKHTPNIYCKKKYKIFQSFRQLNIQLF